MTIRGLVRNGVVVPEEGAALPEGAEVRIDLAVEAPTCDGPRAERTAENGPAPLSAYERYKSIIGVIKDLPSDASERVDDRLYGPPTT
jgi:hypothetical protein